MQSLISYSKKLISYLSKKAKQDLIEKGDENTSLFHGAIKKRRMNNKVIQIRDKKGNLVTDMEGIKEAFFGYYQSLIGSTASTMAVHGPTVWKGKLMQSIHWNELMKPVTNDEIRRVMFFIPNNKSTRLDGYTSLLFKESWSVVGMDVCKATREFFENGKLLSRINATLITLIPKVDYPQSVLEYRHITCCNVLYKCVSKVLYSRLVGVLPDVIGEQQGAFVRGRSILGNILVC